jgi:peptide/nickel transport system substrate-binding protein
MVRSQGRWSRSLVYGASALLVISACSSTGNPTAAPTTQATTSTPTQQATTVPPTAAQSTPTAPSATGTAPTATGTGSTATGTPASSATAASASASGSTGPNGSGMPGQGSKGGTIYLLRATSNDFDAYDPQIVYTGEDLAFFGATMTRSLEAYNLSNDPTVGTTLVPDMATDLGTPSADFKTWTFTMRDGIKWQDGSAVTCGDLAYGISRIFASTNGGLIAGGPTYAMQYLDIPQVQGYTKASDGTISQTTQSAYGGPFSTDGNIPNFFSDAQATQPVANDQAAFDKAVACNGNQITFTLNQPRPDFNFTTTLGFSAVPNPKDHPTFTDPGGNGLTGANLWSDGPYMVSQNGYNPVAGGYLKLERNPNWSAEADPYRPAYPDNWEVDFGLDPKVSDQRMMQSTSNDAFAVQYGDLQPENLNAIFSDTHTANATYAGRAFSDFDPYALYYWIHTGKVTNLQERQAMAVALDRKSIRDNAGGEFVGDYADGVIKPNIGIDYAPTGLWDGSLWGLSSPVPDNGDPTAAAALLQQSGVSNPSIEWDYRPSPTADKNAAIVKSSLEAAGFKVKLNPIDPTHYYTIILNPDTQGDAGGAGWGADWPNAVTVIPDLFTDIAGFNLSRVSDTNGGVSDWNEQVQKASTETDRQTQATDWQNLNKLAMTNVFAIPTFFELAQTIGGTNVGNLYRWPAYGSWPYAALYVKGS